MAEDIKKHPIWLSSWELINSKGVKRKLPRMIVKGLNEKTIMNDPRMVARAIKSLNGKHRKTKWKPIKVTLISQHGYGPIE